MADKTDTIPIIAAILASGSFRYGDMTPAKTIVDHDQNVVNALRKRDSAASGPRAKR